MSAENKCEKQTLHHQSHVIGPQVSVLDPSIFIYIIYGDHDIQVGLYERHHTLFANDIITYMYG